MLCPFVFLFAHFSIRCRNQRRNKFFLPGKYVGINLKPFFVGKTCKTPHIQKLYFVISYKNLPILYCRTLFCILFSVTVFLSELGRSVLTKMPIFFAFIFFPVTYFVSYFVLTHKLINILTLAHKKKDFHFTAPSKGLFCSKALVVKLYFIVSHHVSLVFYFQSR
jgi:hypothetical protein